MKELINNLRDYAELAQASYFNFMYINNDEREMDSYKIGQNRFPKDKDNIENLGRFKLKTLLKNMRLNSTNQIRLLALVLLCFMIKKKISL